ncbi:MAG: formate dehydrogenase accessory sulfurtransferase FdhD [Candidatus Firestonebacteria bacterium]
MEEIKAIRINNGIKENIKEFVAEEVPFTINTAKMEFVTLLCSPINLDDLIRGFLFTSGLIKDVKDIKKITIDEERWMAEVDLSISIKEKQMTFKRLYTSGCGRGVLFYNTLDMLHRTKLKSDFKINSFQINKFIQEFRKKSEVFLKTGCVHAAAIADLKEILIFREDIGRHNAVDKVIGSVLANNISFKDKVLLSTGRISSEIIFKVQKCKIPVIVSKSAPTNQAVKLAKDLNITLVGFARGNRINIYSNEERII